MKIGVIGLGMVGDTVKYGLKRIGHEVSGYDSDPKKDAYDWRAILKTDLTFICVPTPCCDAGQCDVSNVEQVTAQLATFGYAGLAVIKSTVMPGTTDRLERAMSLRLAFCPEFLRERCRFTDFVDTHEVCVIGAYGDQDAELIQKAHGSLPRHFARMKPVEAEMCKYFVNTLHAQKIVFANAFRDVCEAVGADYQIVHDAMTRRDSVGRHYLASSAVMRQFGGSCLPKDTRAFAAFVASLGVPTAVFDNIVAANA